MNQGTRYAGPTAMDAAADSEVHQVLVVEEREEQ